MSLRFKYDGGQLTFSSIANAILPDLEHISSKGFDGVTAHLLPLYKLVFIHM
jgi:hypothetical protein